WSEEAVSGGSMKKTAMRWGRRRRCEKPSFTEPLRRQGPELPDETHNEYEVTFFDTKIHTLVTHTASVVDQWLYQVKSSSSASSSAAGTQPPSWSASTSSGTLPSTATSRTPWPPSSSPSPPTA
ncbi:hypothetical protein Tsubulata_051556, partial [Turnera subulata]